MLQVIKVLPLLVLLLFSATGLAAPLKFVSQQEFEQLAIELAPKVTLFKAVWAANPEAQFFGGTARDYFYWLKGQLQKAKTGQESLEKIAELKKLPTIDVRDFIIGESDVDVISNKALGISPATYGVTKIDFITTERFDPSTEVGRSEIQQGFIPVEKIRLGISGVVHNDNFRNGVAEIYEGKPTLVMPSREVFDQTHYAKQKLNHPILIVIRYIRTLAIDYYRSHGRGYPNENILFDIDSESAKAVRGVSEDLKRSDDLIKFRNEKFLHWFKMSVMKAFRSRTNPTAAYQLFKHFDLVSVLTSHMDEPIGQYVFAQHRDETVIEKNLRDYKVTAEELYVPATEFFPNLKLYHGTGADDDFRLILKQGILPSRYGTAGPGLYGTPEDSRKNAEEYKDRPDLTVVFDVDPNAKVIDLTKPESEKLLKDYFTRNNVHSVQTYEERVAYSKFAEAFGADILVYPYKFKAVVVVNSSVIRNPKGVYKTIATFGSLLKSSKEVRTTEQLMELLSSILESRLNLFEIESLIQEVPMNIEGNEEIKKVDQVLKTIFDEPRVKAYRWFAIILQLGLGSMHEAKTPKEKEVALSVAKGALEFLLAEVAAKVYESSGSSKEPLMDEYARVLKFFERAYSSELWMHLSEVSSKVSAEKDISPQTMESILSHFKRRKNVYFGLLGALGLYQVGQLNAPLHRLVETITWVGGEIFALMGVGFLAGSKQMYLDFMKKRAEKEKADTQKTFQLRASTLLLEHAEQKIGAQIKSSDCVRSMEMKF